MKSKITFVILVSVFLVSSVFGALKPKKVEAIVVQPSIVVKSIRLLGTVKAKREARLQAQAQGTVEEILVHEGERVHKDQLLVVLKNEDLRKQYELAVKNEDLACKTYERLERIHQQGQLSAQKLDDSLQSKLTAEMATYRAKQQLDKTLIKAPFNGVCGSFKVTEGAYVSANERILDVYDDSQLEVVFGVPEWVLPKIQRGQNVLLNGIEGVLVFVDKALDPKTHMGQARAQMAFNASHVGGVAQVDVITDRLETVLALPHTAVFLQEGKPHAYAVRDGKAVDITLETGLSGDDNIEVTGGLVAGDVIISRGYTAVWNGMDVSLTESVTPATTEVSNEGE